MDSGDEQVRLLADDGTLLEHPVYRADLGDDELRDLYRRAFGFGFPGVKVDGNAVLAVYAVTKAAADRARDGGGPTLIEALTYRLGAHTTTDDPTRYRTVDELDTWKAREPIGRYPAFLEKAGLWSDELERDVQAEADRVAAEVRAAVEDLPDPPLSDLVDHVYADPPATCGRSGGGWRSS